MPNDLPLLRDVLTRENMLDLAARKQIVDQAILLFEDFYVHRPQKEAMHAVIPIQRLRLLRAALEALPDESTAAELSSDLAFHREMIAIFASWRDLHTSYLLPRPYNQFLAYLPFMAEACSDEGHTTYVVTRTIGAARPVDFVPGVELLNWNGVPIARAIERNGEGQAGSNTDAYAARGGWHSERQATSITYHSRWGQVARHTVTPEMLDETSAPAIPT